MDTKVIHPTSNRLLAALGAEARDGLLGGARIIELARGDVLCEAGAPARDVYFPLSGFVSGVTMVDGREGANAYLIGDEGMFGAHLLLELDGSPVRVQVQAAGTAACLRADEFQRQVTDVPAFRQLCMAYLSTLFSQLALTAACNARHGLEQRLARWLLMAHDRARGDVLQITHQVLSAMIGVRRSGVSEAIQCLQARGAIHRDRGVVSIVDRTKLEAAACSCYEVGMATDTRMLLSFARNGGPSHGPA